MRINKIFFACVAFIVLCFCSCGNDNKKPQDMSTKTIGIVDSTSALKQQEVDYMVGVINEVSSSLDSISMQENMIYMSTENGSKRDKILAQLKAFKELLAQKQKQIETLKSRSKGISGSNKSAIRNLQKIVDYLEAQLTEKSQQVEKLEEAVKNKDAKISEFRYSLNQANNQNEYLKEQNYQQDKQLNEVYYLVASKKELKVSGILKTGFLKKKKIDNENVDKSKFIKRDIRNLKTITINSKSPRILTNNPASSYTLTKGDDGTSTLTITNPNSFWKVSRYLIIQE